jgi:hypothetical protein
METMREHQGLSDSTFPVAADMIIISGGDELYFPMILELQESLKATTPGRSIPFGVIDAGLAEAQVSQLRDRGATVVGLPRHPDFPIKAMRKIPHAAVDLAKPWLDVMFPGFASLVFVDADAWIQDFAAVELLYGAAQTGALAIVPGSGRYWERQTDVRWLLGGIGGLCQVRSYLFKNGRHAGLPLKVLRDLGNRSLLNAGVFALRADAPHWEAIRAWQARILRNGGKPFTSDGLAMGLSIYVDGLPVELLPDTCNYITRWRMDLAKAALVEFYYPYAKVGIVHLAGQKRMRFDPGVTTEVLDLAGSCHQVSLRFGQFQSMARKLLTETAQQNGFQNE